MNGLEERKKNILGNQRMFSERRTLSILRTVVVFHFKVICMYVCMYVTEYRFS